MECKKLETVIILGDILTISGGAFTGCSESINIELTDNSNYFINEQSLLLSKGDQSNLISILNNPIEVTIPSNVINIMQNAFAYKDQIKTIRFQTNSQLTTIENSAFSICKKLETIDLPTTLRLVGLYAFENCTSLQTINMPNVNKIEDYTFRYCI